MKKKKARKNFARIYEKKKERSEKLHTSNERTKVSLYQEKNDLSLGLNKAALEAF